jgi:5'(3')-deoxyribonucleotidase
MNKLDDVTLVTIETHYHDLAGRALEECVRRIPFRNVVTFSDREIFPGAKNVPVNNITSMRDYCDIMLKGMWPFIETSHMIFVQWDAMIREPNLWNDDFLNYDYIGAVWPWRPVGNNVGNGGFSLRSAKLLQALRHASIQLVPESEHGVQEDNYIAIQHRTLLEQHAGIKFAPQELAMQFSYELGDYPPAMAFHGFWNIINFMPYETATYFFTNRPPNMFSELHRAHHIIYALATQDRMDLFDTAVDEIRACKDYATLRQWLSQENFPNKDHVMQAMG